MKIKVQAQHLQPGDIVGSGERIGNIICSSTQFPSNKICVQLIKYANSDHEIVRSTLWGKYTMINVERAEK